MTMLMGWCMDGHHEQCRTEYITWGGTGDYHRCSCKCHPAVDDEHIAKFLAEHKVAGSVETTVKKRQRKSTSNARVRTPKYASTEPAVATTRKRNVKAEAEAKAAADAALAAIEADESVRERMTELMEEA